MKKAILATKVGMTQIFNEDGQLIPVTVLQAGPCVVTQVKTEEKSCAKASEKSEPVVSKPEDKLVTVNTKGSDWRSKLLAHFYRGH